MARHVKPSDILDVIKELTECDMEADDFEPLKLCRFLPIRRSPTITTYGSVDERFLIIDDDRVQVHPEEPVLDFMPEDVCRLRGFFSALGLEERFVSRQLESVTYPVSNAQESAVLTSELRQKSEALYRYVHCLLGTRHLANKRPTKHCTPLREQTLCPSPRRNSTNLLSGSSLHGHGLSPTFQARGLASVPSVVGERASRTAAC
jgi:hypothetical protein